MEQRLLSLYQQLNQIVKQHQIDEAGIEDIYFAKNAKSAVPVAQAKGVILLVMAQNSIPVAQYSPLEIKRAVGGTGRAEKEQVQELVRMLLGLSEAPKPDHASDALAAAICHLHCMGLKRMIEAAQDAQDKLSAAAKGRLRNV